MATTRVLITVKTYPTISSKYEELVCTAGLLEDGSWIRIYPIPFRKKDYEQQYSKYDWVEIDLVKNTSDFRPESFRPYSIDTPINIVGHLDTASNWQARKDIVLQNVHYDLSELIIQAKNKEVCTSLATYKPTAVIDFIAEPTEREWDKKKIEKMKESYYSVKVFIVECVGASIIEVRGFECKKYMSKSFQNFFQIWLHLDYTVNTIKN